jgi:hypothetical protein
MTIKTVLMSVALILSSTVSAFAACSGHSETAMSCAEGSEYDPATKSCKVVTG